MTKAKVNGIECVVYDFITTNYGTVCRVLYPETEYKMLFPVLAELIEVSL